MIIDMKRTVKEFNWADIDETYDLRIEEMLELYRIPDKPESIIETTK